MTNKEKELFFNLCSYKNQNKNKIEKLLEGGCATAEVLGQLSANRMDAAAYHTLSELELTDKADREFRNSLKNASLINEKINDDYFALIKEISPKLESLGVPYAMLNGAYLCNWYPNGYRTTDTVELLVLPKNIRKISVRLKRWGFKRSEHKGKNDMENKFKKERRIVFVRDSEDGLAQKMKIALVTSADTKKTEVLRAMLDRPRLFITKGVTIKTPDRYDFLLCLCAIAYEYATSMSEVRNKKDMPLYTYCDIFAVLKTFSKNDLDYLLIRAKENKMEDVLNHCIFWIKSFFGNGSVRLNINKAFLLNYVFDKENKKIYRYTEPEPSKRLFADDRIELLELLEYDCDAD